MAITFAQRRDLRGLSRPKPLPGVRDDEMWHLIERSAEGETRD